MKEKNVCSDMVLLCPIFLSVSLCTCACYVHMFVSEPSRKGVVVTADPQDVGKQALLSVSPCQPSTPGPCVLVDKLLGPDLAERYEPNLSETE